MGHFTDVLKDDHLGVNENPDPKLYTEQKTKIRAKKKNDDIMMMMTYVIGPQLLLVEEHEYDHVKRRHLDDVLAQTLGRAARSAIVHEVHRTGVGALHPEECGVEVSGTMLGLKAQLATTVLPKVEPSDTQQGLSIVWLVSE